VKRAGLFAEEVERAAGIEPATYSLGSCRSTTELRPRTLTSIGPFQIAPSKSALNSEHDVDGRNLSRPLWSHKWRFCAGEIRSIFAVHSHRKMSHIAVAEWTSSEPH
jgi:hypothetical protein